MVLNWQPHWKTLPTKSDLKIVPEDLLPYTAYIKRDSIKYLSIMNERGVPEYLSNVIDFVAEQDYNRISQVSLSMNSFLERDFFKLAACCGDALTDIRITNFGHERNIVQADTLLKHCPNLEKLFFQGMILNDPTLSSTLWKPNLNGFKHTKLTSLTLIYIIKSMSGFSFIAPFLQAAPKLKQLHLNMDNLDNAMDSSDMILFLQQNCPDLTTLAFSSIYTEGLYNDIFDKMATTTTTTLTEESNGIKEGNLKRLLLHGCVSRPHLVQNIFTTIVQRFSATLESIDLVGQEVLNEVTMRCLSSLVFVSLKRLKLMLRVLESIQNPELLESFFENSIPNVVHLSLIDVTFGKNNTTFPKLYSGTKYLRKLELMTINDFTEDDLASYLEMAGPQLQVLGLRLDLLGPISLSVLFTKCTNLKELTVFTLLRSIIVELHNQFEQWESGEKKRLRKLEIIFRGGMRQYPNEIIDGLINRMDQHAVEWYFEATCPKTKKKDYAIYNKYLRRQKFTHVEYRRQKSHNQQHAF
ncbi:hypothetical protein INT45_003952 [Circinella minor]|uniref:Uncharacterized protein n=1 Tax=Circinella minor TaxID=1195481 RepID=A0A8H7VFS2_9FUNG|nr:hypothetical protein INT45_003952 [Circinella minor]